MAVTIIQMLDGFSVEILGGLTPTRDPYVFTHTGMVELRFHQPKSPNVPGRDVDSVVSEFGDHATVTVAWRIPVTRSYGGNCPEWTEWLNWKEVKETFVPKGHEVSFSANAEDAVALTALITKALNQSFRRAGVFVTIAMGLVQTTFMVCPQS